MGRSSAHRRFLLTQALVGASGLLLAAAALAAAPLPKTASAYSTGAGKHKVSITLVTGASDPKKIEPGAAALGSQFALSGGSLQCPKAKKGPGFHGTPFAIFGFPGAELKLSHGKYAFSKTAKEANTAPLGSAGVKPFTLKVRITGTVLSPTKIAGTVTAKGGPCTTKLPLKYTAKPNPKLPVAPGQ
jgi:hypothetical protein